VSSVSTDRLRSATMKYEGMARSEPGDRAVELFSLGGVERPVWLEVWKEWIRADYTAVIRNFGITDSAAARSTIPEMQIEFSTEEKDSAIKMIRQHLAGPDGCMLAFNKGRCLDVKFPYGWIRLKKNQ
jgi:hypothetical protein